MKLIHQLARETGISIGTIRFYEKTGLFSSVKHPGTLTNNYGYYTEEVVKKLEFIKAAKSVGFTLAEIKEIIEAWYEQRLSKEDQLEVLEKKLFQIDTKIKELEEIKKQIWVIKNDINTT